jgi:ABC-type amino acid transport substrate-binding protein
MRLTFVTIAALLASAIAIAGSGAARSAASPTLVSPGTLTIATYGTGFPTVVVNKNGTLGGTSGAWINAYAKANNLKIKLFQTTFTSAILAVEQKKADLTMDIYYTPERAKSLYYTYPFSVEGLQVYTKKGFNYTGPASLKGHKVAAVSGVVWTPGLMKYFGSDLQEYPSQADAATAFLNGQVDAYFEADAQYFVPPINKSPNVVPHNLKDGDYGLTGYAKGYGYIIVNCGAKDLATGLDATLAQMEKSGQWSMVLKAAGAPAGTLADEVPPRTSPAQGC